VHGGGLRRGRTRAEGGQLADTEVARSNHARGGGREVAVRRQRAWRWPGACGAYGGGWEAAAHERRPTACGGGREIAGAEGRGQRRGRRRSARKAWDGRWPARLGERGARAGLGTRRSLPLSCFLLPPSLSLSALLSTSPSLPPLPFFLFTCLSPPSRRRSSCSLLPPGRRSSCSLLPTGVRRAPNVLVN
jgi:hypothetical protein